MLATVKWNINQSEEENLKSLVQNTLGAIVGEDMGKCYHWGIPNVKGPRVVPRLPIDFQQLYTRLLEGIMPPEFPQYTSELLDPYIVGFFTRIRRAVARQNRKKQKKRAKIAEHENESLAPTSSAVLPPSSNPKNYADIFNPTSGKKRRTMSPRNSHMPQTQQALVSLLLMNGNKMMPV
jgi:hypothetical protein